MVGIGWAVIRGSRLKKGKNLKEPIEATGVFKTKPIQGIQIRLYNVEVIPYNRVYGMFDVKISHQPVGQIWGEIYLFNEKIMIDPKRENFVNEGLTKTIREEIKKWIEETLKYTENRRHEKTSWKKVLENNNRVKASIENIATKLSGKTKNYRIKLDIVKNFLENWKKKDYKALKDKLDKAIKTMEDEFEKIKTLNYVIDGLDTLIKDAKNQISSFFPLLDNYIKSILDRIQYREEKTKLKEEQRIKKETKKADDKQEPEKEEVKKADDKQEPEKEEVKKTDDKQEPEKVEAKKADDKQEPEKVEAKKADDKQEEESEEEINEWEQFKEFVFSSYELNNLEAGLLVELIDIVDLYIENDDDKKNIVNRILLLLNEQVKA